MFAAVLITLFVFVVQGLRILQSSLAQTAIDLAAGDRVLEVCPNQRDSDCEPRETFPGTRL